ncbi:MAG TPA: endonuclease VIII, partial [Lachnospiraceae bacterium]|nr:endonuclease VIII [Lachnospiraceae bacterium]
MIEIPESLTIAGQLNETVCGKRITEVVVAQSGHKFAWYVGDPADYAEKMEGKVVGPASGIGSIVEFALDDLSFAVGDGTNIRYYGAEEKLPDKYETRITFEDESSLVCTVQMYGSMLLFDPREYDNPYYWVGKRKPMPGSTGFTMDYFQGLLKDGASKLAAKAFLATEQRIPGLGNGVLQDILLEANLHPKRKMNTLTDAEIQNL